MVANLLWVDARVAMHFLGCSGWLLRFLFEDVWADTRIVMRSLGCSKWLLRCSWWILRLLCSC